MAGPDQINEALRKKLGGTVSPPGPVTGNTTPPPKKAVVGKSPKPTGVPKPRINVKQAREEKRELQLRPVVSERKGLGGAFEDAVSGRSFLNNVFGVDISGLPDPLEYLVDLVVNPATLATAGVGAGVKLPLQAAGKIGLGRVAATPLGKLAWRGTTDTAVAAASGKAAQETAERIPEDAPDWVKIAAPFVAAGLTQSVSTRTANRSMRLLDPSLGTSAVAADAAQWARADGHEYMAPLQDFDELIDGFKTVENNRPLREFYTRLGIDPVVGETTEAGQGMHAWARNAAAVDDAANLAVRKALPTEFNAFKFTPEGGIEDMPLAKGIHFNDIFSYEDAPTRFGFNARQTQQWESAFKLLREVEDFSDQHGVKIPLWEADGRYYWPRQVRGAKGVELEKPSDVRLARVWEDATQGAAKGSNYSNPMEAVALRVKTAYRAAVDQQLQDYIDEFTVLPSRAYAASPRGANLSSIYKGAIKTFTAAKRADNALVKRIAALDARMWEASRGGVDTPRFKQLEAQLASARHDLKTKTRPALKAAATAKASAKSRLARDYQAYKKSGNTKVSGKLFGGSPTEEIPVGMWKGRFISQDNLDALERWFDPTFGVPLKFEGGPVVRAAGQVNNALRTSASVADFAMPFLQGLPLLAKDPTAWGAMAARHYLAFFSPGWQARYINRHIDELQQMALESRIPIEDTEFFKALREPNLQSQVTRQTLGRFQRSYNTGLMVTRHQLWAALKDAKAGSPEDIGKMVRNMTGGLETQALGVGPRQRTFESMAFFSPKLFRSTVALFADAARPWTPAGAQAAHTLMRMTAASAGFFALANAMAGTAEGETDEEIEERIKTALNPLEGKKFLSVKVGDNWYGVGGQTRALTQFVANAIGGGLDMAKGGELKIGDQDVDENPFVALLNLLQSRGSPLQHFSLAGLEAATGEKLDLLPFDYIDDVPSLLEYSVSNVGPFLLQSALEMGRDPFVDLVSLDSIKPLLANLGGARQSTLTPFERRDDLSVEETGYHYRDLTNSEKRDFRNAHPDLQAVIDDYGDRDQRLYKEEVDFANETARTTLTSIAQALEAGKFSDMRVFREEIEDVMSARAVLLDAARRKLGADQDTGPESLTRRAVDAYFQTFVTARRNPADPNSPVDFEVLDQNQATLERDIDNEIYGPPDQVREAIEERASFDWPPELQQFVANKKLILDSGYWDIRDQAFAQIRGEVNAIPGFGGVQSSGEVGAIRLAAQRNGDQQTLQMAKAIESEILKRTKREHEALRRTVRGLDEALLSNGYVTKPVDR